MKDYPSRYVVKGTFYDTPDMDTLRCREGYLLVEDGIVQGFDEDPEQWKKPSEELPVYDYSGHMITPGFSDLHLHASQYRYCGMAMDVPLLQWLNHYAFPEEARYQDPAYAAQLYRVFTRDIIHSATTRACIFATIHTDATMELMDQLEEAGIKAYVGKLNMDRNSPDYYCEPSVEEGMKETRRWLDLCESRNYANVKPMITPRFTPSVTDAYMRELGQLVKERKLPVQSHLSENNDEIKWVSELCPNTRFYGEAYDQFGMFGSEAPTVMAHCIYSGEEESALMKRQNVCIAHCPTSNENVIAGIAPAAKYLRNGYFVGLGSDVSGGHTLNLFAVMAAAIQVSKLYWKYISEEEKPLTLTNAFYMATVGGGAFFGKVGRFEPGYEFDAVVLQDSVKESPIPFTPEERLERYTYRSTGEAVAKFIAGRKVL